MFSEVDQEKVEPGLYVSVHEGIVTLEGEDGYVDIGPGEDVWTNGDETGRIPNVPFTEIYAPLGPLPDPESGPCYIS